MSDSEAAVDQIELGGGSGRLKPRCLSVLDKPLVRSIPRCQRFNMLLESLGNIWKVVPHTSFILVMAPKSLEECNRI